MQGLSGGKVLPLYRILEKESELGAVFLRSWTGVASAAQKKSEKEKRWGFEKQRYNTVVGANLFYIKRFYITPLL